MPDRVKGRAIDRGDPKGSPWGGSQRFFSGIHDLTLAELLPVVATTPYRRQMWNRLIAFMSWPVMDGRFSYAYFGGGFVSTTPRPQDIDLILQTSEPYGPEAFRVIERYFRVGLESINSVFGIHLHFWMENAPEGFSDYRVFFQYAKPEKPHHFAKQGLVRVALLGSEMKKELRQLLSGFELTDDVPPGCEL